MTLAEKIEFELVTPNQVLISQFAELVVVPGSEGYLGVMPGHIPLVSALKPGVVDIYQDSIHQDGSITSRLFISGGIVEITRKHCTVLTEEAIALEEIDREQTEQSLRNLQEDLEEVTAAPAREVLQQRIHLCQEKLAALASSK